MYRLYNFDSLLPNGSTTAGSSSSAQAPMLECATGLATATPQQRVREQCEKFFFLWDKDFDGTQYWGHDQYLSCYTVIGVGNATIVGATLAAGLYMGAPGPPIAAAPTMFTDPSGIPLVILRYIRNDIITGDNERFELVTSRGDGIEATKVTVLTGVDPPRTPPSPGGPRGQRYEIIYKAGQYVAARIDGVEGARHTTNIPNTAFIPAAGSNGAGVGVWAQDCNINDSIRASFYTMLAEMYRAY